MQEDQQYAFYFNNYQVQCLFAKQLKEIPKYQLKVQYGKIWITIICDHHGFLQMGSENFQFVIKIGKGFPLSSVRLYLMKSPLVPKISDTRDLLDQCLGSNWTRKNRLKDIYNQLNELIYKLSKRSQGYLSLQKTGEFHLTQYFSVQQLDKYSNLTTFINLTNKNDEIPRLVVVGVSQTHLLVFKNDKQSAKNNILSVKQILHPNFEQKVYLSRVCELQCISNIFYYRQSNEVDVTFTQYHNARYSNKNKKTYESFTKRYKFLQPQSFLKCLLKNITKFQPLRITHSASKGNISDQISQLISKIQKMQQRLYATNTNSKIPKPTAKQQNILKSELDINYRKIIQLCSAIDQFQYLIYINKMNDLYKQQINN